ncbi:hypothetical protein EPF86_22070 [Salmonella enterica]|nr:hypothetical protein [Salmonella enterica]EAS4157671.1 hypothetical protein [Salmonella enterica]EAS9473031.1 hypothetical protein [Salmonella enterica]EBJ6030105.1 hypothetical protein [Salmonella enterica]EBJ9989139.1 hypothetical protein [Salmonella enterica]
MSADGGKQFLYVRIAIDDQSCFSHNSADSNFNNVFFIFFSTFIQAARIPPRERCLKNVFRVN